MYPFKKSRISALPLLLPALLACSASAQQSGTRPVQLPLFGSQQSGVSTQQSATPGMGSSVNTLNTQVQVQGSYASSALDPSVTGASISLTLTEAVRRGLEFNLGKTGADAASRQAMAQHIAARSAKVDLAAEGFSSSVFGSFGGFKLPTTAGPFHYYDLHGSLEQSLFDLTAIHNDRAAGQSADAAVLNARQAREEVVLAVTGSYLQLMATAALIDEQRVEVQYAEASHKQARAQADAGNKAPIDANRSLVELQTEQQRLRSQIADMQKQKNALARLIGLPAGQNIFIAEKLEAQPGDTASVEEIVRRAWEQRLDLRAAEAQLRAAEEARKAAAAEYLPSASVSGTYGVQGVNPNSGNGTFQASASLTIPLFNGGRTHADTQQADAVVSERRAELSSQRATVELEVRNAFIDLTVANDQVNTAQSNRQLALSILQQSEDRFGVGVADSVEVVSSQQALASADHDYVSSLFAQNLARISLAHAMGEAEKVLADLYKGSI
jgi:outer membrane protein TolC